MKSDRVYLLHIQDALKQIRVYTQAGEPSFFADRKTQDAVLRNIEIVGEATKKLSPKLKQAHPDVPWKQVAGMRDKVIHDYFGVNLRLVWQTTQGSMVVFERQLEAILAGLLPEEPSLVL